MSATSTRIFLGPVLSLLFGLIFGLILGLIRVPAATAATAAQTPELPELTTEVMKAHGIAAWQKASRVEFTFEVQNEGKTVMSAQHVWDRVAGTDTVTHEGKTVTASLNAPPAPGTPEAKAYARWVNDSYWLIAPLKLADPGATTEDLGEQEFEGSKVRVLQLSFKGVGLTPGDRYHLFIDPRTHLVVGWVYMPTPDKKVPARWLDTTSFGGVNISQTRAMGGRSILFKNVRIE